MSESMSHTYSDRGNGHRGALLTGVTAVGGTGAAIAMARRRKRRRSTAEKAQVAAARLPERARELSGEWTKGLTSKMEDRQFRMWGLAALALTWLFVRMAEVRQLKRMNRILISTRA